MQDQLSWNTQWDGLVAQALQKLAGADLETKSRFSEGLAKLPYTATEKTKELVDSLKALMERVGLLSHS